MNHIYRTLWNTATRTWQAVPETAQTASPSSASGRTSRHTPPATPTGIALRHLCVSLALAWGVGLPLATLAQTLPAPLPTGASVVAGQASIAQAGRVMTITQTTPKLATNWQSFNIGAGHSVNFVQPSASAVALNRVTGADVSTIQGALNANGQVFLVNPNGVLFTPTAQVNVGSLVASTLNLSNDDFLKGNYRFVADPANPGFANSAIVNQGQIVVVGDGAAGGTGGTVALLAAKVSQSGSVQAPSGQVLIGAGNRITLDLGGPVKLNIEQGALNALIEQGGAIEADGGLIYLSAQALGALTRSVIQHTGTSRAQTLASGQSGRIYLLGGMQQDRIEVGGTLDASAPQGGHGGFVETSAAQVNVAPSTRVTTLAPQGQTGTWLIDPTNFTISNDDATQTGSGIGATTLNTNLGRSSVTLQTQAAGSDSGNLYVDGPVTWSSGTTLTLSAHSNIYINQNIDARGGSGGKLVLKYGQGTPNGYDLDANGNNQLDLFKRNLYLNYYLAQGVKVNLQAGQNFSTVLGSAGTPVDYTVITNLGAAGDDTKADATNSLQGLGYATRLTGGNYVLGADLDASSTRQWNYDASSGRYLGFAPIGYYTAADTTNNVPAVDAPFSGNFSGLGHTLSNLTINRPSTSRVGLWGNADTLNLRDLTLTNPSVTGGDSTAAVVGYVRRGDLRQVQVFDPSIAGGDYTGGVVGGQADPQNAQDVLSLHQLLVKNQQAATGRVTGKSPAGGLAGWLYSGSIEDSGVEVPVVGGNQVGGLAGAIGTSSVAGFVRRSYATGSVTRVISGTSRVGGLVGLLVNERSRIDNSYATGVVKSTDSGGFFGGLVGENEGTIANSYAKGGVALTRTPPVNSGAGGLVGKNTDTGVIQSSWSQGTVSAMGATLYYVGLVGNNDGLVSGSYSLADVVQQSTSSSSFMAGLVGYNTGSITDSYAKGNIRLADSSSSGNAKVAALVYRNTGTVETSYALILVTTSTVNAQGQYTPAAGSAYSGGGLVGLGTTGVTRSYWYNPRLGTDAVTDVGTLLSDASGTSSYLSASSYGNFDFTNTWFIYEGKTAPMLRSFMTLVTLTPVSGSKTYDGSALWQGGSYTPSTSTSVTVDTSKLLGSAVYTADSKNVGPRSVTMSGLYSDQNGYIISYNPGTLTIEKASYTGISASKTYDGSSTFSGVTVNGVNGETFVADTATANSKNVDAQRFTSVGTLTASNADNPTSNYNPPEGTAPGTLAIAYNVASITPKVLSASVSAQDKTYDGTRDATSILAITNGLVGSETLGVSGKASFADKNVGQAKTVTVDSVALSDGSNGGLASNYVLQAGQTTTASINPAPVVVAVAAATKPFDGTTEARSALTVVTGSLYSGDQLKVGGFVFDSPQPGTGKTVTAQDLTIDDGNNGNNYQVQVLANAQGVIEAPADSDPNANSQQHTKLQGAQLSVACLPITTRTEDEANNCRMLNSNAGLVAGVERLSGE